MQRKYEIAQQKQQDCMAQARMAAWLEENNAIQEATHNERQQFRLDSHLLECRQRWKKHKVSDCLHLELKMEALEAEKKIIEKRMRAL